MNLMTHLARFIRDEDGAVTVDWVVLTSAIVGMGMIILIAIGPSVSNLSVAIGEKVALAQERMEAEND
jgi:Flp pilus assembly pilin Flp